MLFVAFRIRLRARTQVAQTAASSATRSRVRERLCFAEPRLASCFFPLRDVGEKITEKLFSAFRKPEICFRLSACFAASLNVSVEKPSRTSTMSVRDEGGSI